MLPERWCVALFFALTLATVGLFVWWGPPPMAYTMLGSAVIGAECGLCMSLVKDDTCSP